MNNIEVKQFKFDDFEFFQKITPGKYSCLKLFKRKSDEKLFIIKVVKKSHIIKNNLVNKYVDEVKFLNDINFVSICNLIGISHSEKYLHLIFEYTFGGDFYKYIRQINNINENDSKIYVAQIINIFDFLHNKNIIYRNLKPENLFFDQLGYLKLFNFELSKQVISKTFTICGTAEYMAPEVILNKGHDKAVDWWTLGIFLYEILVGIDPFCDEDPYKIYENILNLKMKFPSFLKNEPKSLIKKLLVLDISKRLGNLKRGTEDIKNHKFFNNFNWNDVEYLKSDLIYKPDLKKELLNFRNYPDSNEEVEEIKINDDPFQKF